MSLRCVQLLVPLAEDALLLWCCAHPDAAAQLQVHTRPHLSGGVDVGVAVGSVCLKFIVPVRVLGSVLPLGFAAWWWSWGLLGWDACWGEHSLVGLTPRSDDGDRRHVGVVGLCGWTMYNFRMVLLCGLDIGTLHIMVLGGWLVGAGRCICFWGLLWGINLVCFWLHRCVLWGRKEF